MVNISIQCTHVKEEEFEDTTGAIGSRTTSFIFHEHNIVVISLGRWRASKSVSLCEKTK